MNREEREQFAERLLDQALQQYSAAEPRPDLEARILHNLANRRTQPWYSFFAMPRFIWPLMATAALLAIALGTWQYRKPAMHPSEVAQTSAPAATRTIVPPEIAPSSAVSPTATPIATRRHTAQPPQLARREPPPELPRREQFPSPAPLSDQELLLLTYLRTTPREEVLLAVAQREAEREQEMERFFNDSTPSGR
jgi:hypothetical protein